MDKKKRVRILQIPSGGLYGDGIFSCITAYLAAMDRTDIDTDVISFNTPSEKIKRILSNLGCNLVIITNRKKNPIFYFCSLLSCMKRYDVVEVHGSSIIMAIELLAAKLCGCKARIAHSHNTTCDHKILHRLLLPLFHAVYTDAYACGHDAGKWLFGKKPYTVIPNGRNLRQFSYCDQARKEIRCQYALGNDIVIGHVGGFNFQKNHEFLIDVFYEICKIRQNVKLVLMGTGSLMPSIHEKVLHLGLEERVIFAGHIDNMPQMLSAMDVMMLPSRHEGLPMVALEWQISGLPCLISNKVTDECRATELVSFLPIDRGTKPWIDAFCNVDIVMNREEMSKTACLQMKQAHYDIEENAKKLRMLYLEAVNR